MPCDTPPPPSPIDDMNNDGNNGNVEELDESMYDFIEIGELENIPQDGVLQSLLPDDSARTFVGHKDAVFSCNFDKTGQYIATGSQDETAFVWHASTGAVKFECTGHKDSVIFANFSPDSKYVASADMNGVVQVFDMDDGSLVWSFDTYEFTWAEWLHGSNVLLAGSVDGSCWMWSIPDGNSVIFENAGVSISIGAASHNDEKLCVGYSDGSMKFWDLNTTSQLGSLSGSSAFKGAVTAVKYSPDDALILSASEDGSIKLIKMSDLKVIWSVVVCDLIDHVHEDVSVETVAFCNNPSLIAVGTNCGLLCMYDISSKTKRDINVLTSAVVKIISDDSAPVLYAALADGILEAFDVRTGDGIRTWFGHKLGLLDFAISSDRSLLLTSSDDHTCKIFERGNL